MTLAKYDLDAIETLAFTERRFLTVCWPADARDVDEALGIGPANFGDIGVGIDDI